MLATALRRTVLSAFAALVLATQGASAQEFPLQRVGGGVYILGARVNDALRLNFVLDTGAAEVSISEEVLADLVRLGAIAPREYLIERSYTDASGRSSRRRRVMLRSVRVGDLEVRNVAASVGGKSSPLLLGQSFLARLDHWSIDNRRRIFVVGTPSPGTASQATLTLQDNDERDALGRTSLMRAVGQGAGPIKELLARGAARDARDNAGWTALLLAADRGDLGAAEALIAAGADVNARNNLGWTPLMTAVSRGNLPLIEALIAARADPKIRNNDGWTALTIARSRSDERLIEVLQRAGATE
jgi:clan AA aspartic protease (TIGR02281 family)